MPYQPTVLATPWSYPSRAPTHLSIKTSAVSDSLPSWSLTSSLERREVDERSGQPQFPGETRCSEKIREETRRGRLIEGKKEKKQPRVERSVEPGSKQCEVWKEESGVNSEIPTLFGP